MGASGWSYFVPYQPDIQKALQELREVVFQRGGYYRREESCWHGMTFEQYMSLCPCLPGEDQATYWGAFQRLQSLPEPTLALLK